MISVISGKGKIETQFICGLSQIAALYYECYPSVTGKHWGTLHAEADQDSQVLTRSASRAKASMKSRISCREVSTISRASHIAWKCLHHTDTFPHSATRVKSCEDLGLRVEWARAWGYSTTRAQLISVQ